MDDCCSVLLVVDVWEELDWNGSFKTALPHALLRVAQELALSGKCGECVLKPKDRKWRRMLGKFSFHWTMKLFVSGIFILPVPFPCHRSSLRNEESIYLGSLGYGNKMGRSTV